MKRRYIFLVLTLIIFNACNDDFLDKYPIDSQTEGTAFRTYNNFQTYPWSLYAVFTDNTNYVQGIVSNLGRYNGDWRAGYFSTYATTENNQYRSQTSTVPSS